MPTSEHVHPMRRAVAIAILAFAATNAAAQQAPDPDALIAAARAASGGAAWDRIAGWVEHGTISAGGLSGTYDAIADFPARLQALSYVLGPDHGRQGWDGHAAWSTDSSGQVRAETSREAEAAAIQSAYLATSGVFFPARSPAQRAYAGKRVADGVTYDAVKITPQGAEPVEFWFDPKSHLIVREIQLTGAQPQTSILSDFREEAGVRVPGRTIVRVGGNPKYDVVTTVSAAVSQPVPAARFAPPPPPAYDAAFPGGRSAVTVPFRLINNHIYLQASIDGRPPQSFVFDTGATNFLDRAHAKSLGVAIAGALPGGGFGSDISAVGLAKVASVSIGGLTLHDQVFAANDSTAWITLEGEDSAGLLGYEFAKRAVTTIDYAAGTITFTRPDAFTPPAGTPIPFTFDAHIPMVEASVDGVQGEFEIDTGARSALTLMHPFADAHGLAAKYKATRIATTGYGVGGPSRALLARPGVLTIGPVSLANPVADLVMDTGGAAAEARTAGNIGGDILKRFTVTLDYGHQRLWLVPNALAAEPDIFDRAGLWITRAPGGAIAIADISKGGAAEQAGLAVGDAIQAVDGTPAKDIPLYTLRDSFKKAPGTAFRLSVTGKGGARTMTLRLADQV